jgi:hypothetical protein
MYQGLEKSKETTMLQRNCHLRFIITLHRHDCQQTDSNHGLYPIETSFIIYHSVMQIQFALSSAGNPWLMIRACQMTLNKLTYEKLVSSSDDIQSSHEIGVRFPKIPEPKAICGVVWGTVSNNVCARHKHKKHLDANQWKTGFFLLNAFPRNRYKVFVRASLLRRSPHSGAISPSYNTIIQFCTTVWCTTIQMSYIRY